MQRQFTYSARGRGLQDPLAVIVYGLGAIGLEVARSLCECPGLRLAGAVDTDPAKVGRDVAELLGPHMPPVGVTVRAHAQEILQDTPASAVIHTTGSFFPDVYPQLVPIIQAGLPVISSAEELAYPYLQYPELARALDDLAVQRGVAVIGLGVNPGFVMDALPVVLSWACRRVTAVRVYRAVDAARRRGNLQRKIGAGLNIDQFQDAAATGRFGHVGLVESLALVAEGLDWDLDRITETMEPVIAPQAVSTEHVTVAAGQVAGIHQVAKGRWQDEDRIVLDLTMAVGHPHPHDAIALRGDPSLDLRLSGGVSGDAATVGRLVNAVHQIRAARPGLLTVLDLPAGGRPGGRNSNRSARSVALPTAAETGDRP